VIQFTGQAGPVAVLPHNAAGLNSCQGIGRQFRRYDTIVIYGFIPCQPFPNAKEATKKTIALFR
jgi:hypothetical protein